MDKKEKSAAVLTIKAASNMTDEGRREIAAWLRRQAKHLIKHGEEYTEGNFRARYLYTEE
jgi:hypothetical protein